MRRLGPLCQVLTVYALYREHSFSEDGKPTLSLQRILECAAKTEGIRTRTPKVVALKGFPNIPRIWLPYSQWVS